MRWMRCVTEYSRSTGVLTSLETDHQPALESSSCCAGESPYSTVREEAALSSGEEVVVATTWQSPESHG